MWYLAVSGAVVRYVGLCYAMAMPDPHSGTHATYERRSAALRGEEGRAVGGL